MHINSIHEICLIKCSPADVERMGVESTGVNVGSSGLKPPNVGGDIHDFQRLRLVGKSFLEMTQDGKGGSQLIFHVQAQMCADSYLIDVPTRKLGAISLFTVQKKGYG